MLSGTTERVREATERTEIGWQRRALTKTSENPWAEAEGSEDGRKEPMCSRKQPSGPWAEREVSETRRKGISASWPGLDDVMTSGAWEGALGTGGEAVLMAWGRGHRVGGPKAGAGT